MTSVSSNATLLGMSKALTDTNVASNGTAIIWAILPGETDPQLAQMKARRPTYAFEFNESGDPCPKALAELDCTVFETIYGTSVSAFRELGA